MRGLAFLLLLVVLPIQATQIEVRGLFAGQAVLVIDGRQRLLKEGARSPEGVLLKRATSKQAIVELDGVEHTIALSRSISATFKPAEKVSVRLQQTGGGHYVTTARINGRAVEVMVDTGATTVAFNQVVAKKLGINYRRGDEVRMSTASGMSRGYRVMLDSVAVGGVIVSQVEATVTEGNFPTVVLLGNSFLQRVEMRRELGVLVLETQL